MMKDLSKILLMIIGVCATTFAQQTDSTEFRHYKRNDNTFLQNYNPNDKEKYFPLNSFNRGTGIWTELNPNVPRVDYIGVDFINPDTGWACGLWGAAIKTTNGGQNWTTLETPTGEILLKVHSYNGQTVIVVGHNGTIIRSSDGGESFILLTGITAQELWGVKMLNDTLGWICGRNQTLLKTTDAGLTWQSVNTGFNYHYWQFDFLSEDYFMIACSQGRVLRTTNGGQSFTQHQAGSTQDLYTIDIIDSLHIAAAGYFGKNVYSSDGGINWITNQTLTSLPVNWIQFMSNDTGYAVVESSISMYRTTNRGQSWSLTGFNRTGEWQFEFLSDSLGYGVGAGLTVTKTEDGYISGTNLFLNKNWSEVFFVNEMKGFLISADLGAGIYKTEDGGISYQKIENTPSGYDLFFLDSLIGFVAGTHKTTDGGENWYPVNGGGTKVFFINDSVGWSIESSTIYKTTDSGENWVVQSNSGWLFTSIYFIDSLYGWASQVSGRPFKTTDGGQNWIEQTNLDIWQSRDVFFIDYLNGILLESNKLYETADGGITWVQNQSLTGFSIAELSTYEDSTIFIIGYKTYRSLDGGEKWFEFTELDGIRITGLSLLNSGLGYAAGELGFIAKYFDSTYVPVELKSFQGEANYNSVVLHWQTASEINNRGFEIERSKSESKVWQNIGFVDGNGTTTEEHNYYYIDFIDEPGNYFYRLKQIDYNGNFEYSKVVDVTVQEPGEFLLLQNYPNPFNNVTVITYQIPTNEFVILKIYDVLGNNIKTLVEENKKSGYYTINYSANDLSSGIYFYKLTTSKYSSTKKFILLK